MRCCRSRRKQGQRTLPPDKKKPSNLPEGINGKTSLFQVVFCPATLLAVVPRRVQVVDEVIQAAEGEAARQSIARQRIVRERENVIDGRTVEAGSGVLQLQFTEAWRRAGYAAEPNVQGEGGGLLRQLTIAGGGGVQVIGSEGARRAACGC